MAPTKTGRTPCSACALLYLSLCLPWIALAAQFEVTDLGTMGGASSKALAINNRNEIVGQSTDANGVGHACIWRKGVHRAISGCDSASSAGGINDGGMVLGWCGNNSTTVVWRDGTQ